MSLIVKSKSNMTAILGLKDSKGKLYLIGDSYTGDVSGDYKSTCFAPKVYKISEFIVGLCGSPKHELIFEEVIKSETKKKTFSHSEEWLKFKFPKLVKASCVSAGLVSKDEDGEDIMGTTEFVIGYKKTFYHFDSDFSLWATNRSTVAIGIAANYGLGALTVLEKNDDLTSEEKLTRAMDVALELSHYVAKPYITVSV